MTGPHFDGSESRLDRGYIREEYFREQSRFRTQDDPETERLLGLHVRGTCGDGCPWCNGNDDGPTR